eukprot:g1199.t1
MSNKDNTYSNIGKIRLSRMKKLDTYDPRVKRIDPGAALRKLHIEEEEHRLEDIAREYGAHRSKHAEDLKARMARLESIKNDLNDAFDMFDTERDGHIQKKYVATVLMSAGLIPTQKSMRVALASIPSAPVDLKTVYAIARRFAYEDVTKDTMVRTFKEVFDKDDSGFVDSREIMEAAKNLEQTDFTEQELQMLLDYCGVKDVSEGKSNNIGLTENSLDASAVLQILWDK